ncbi:lysophospholipid acyltransferase family protein [Isachenkonia alkalipeptolytica]|uniref:1-acyl-sn-glycerol-3-phosphate acyltransferase n=1 Tax=Isachenkonia alkalipeptolytica TaxID=2565777 RepID=A0AA44BDE6_9CLOT|nr:lysophospholipid acyltransferase family protein [Isachenkonia alkalipeptolytica]NBG87030.1 1-acyl-sn-glycerol-3-phosphate acyltransferase [Isachenkonia alkalipeptolytica]
MTHIFFVIFFVSYMLFIALTFPLHYYYGKKGPKDKKRNLVYKINRSLSKNIVRFSGCDLEIIGKENIPDQAALYVSNHQSYMDIPLLVHVLDQPLGFVAKKELRKVPIIGKWIYFTESVFIDRKDIRQSLRAINDASKKIKDGHSMVIFPEGTRSKSSEMNPFKPGSLKIAEKAKSYVVPVTIIDSYKLYEGNKSRVRPAKVKIVISKPLPPQEKGQEKTSDNTVTVLNTLKENLKEHQIS